MCQIRKSKLHRIAALAALAAFTGLCTSACYGYYQPVAPDLAGHVLQLSITDSGSVVLAPQIGYGIETVDGKLISDSDMRYQVAVTGIRHRDGQETDWKGEAVNIPHAVVSTVMERRFSRARTTLFAAGLVALTLPVATPEMEAGRADQLVHDYGRPREAVLELPRHFITSLPKQ
jgi:hypothetical protein